MTASNTDAAFTALLIELEQRAAQVAEAYATSRQMAKTADERRWRRPDLLWPTFVRDR